MIDEPIENGWVKLYHPSGALVTIPLSAIEPITVDQARIFVQSVDNLVAAGFSPDMPGLEEGELMEEISAIARREAADMTPIIDFYSSNTKLEKKFMHVYLNAPEDVTAFEQATGVRLDTLDIYDGQQAVERSHRNAARYIRQLAAPVKLVYKISPKWEQWKQAGGEGKEPHKRLLVRYEAGWKPANSETPQPEPTTEGEAETTAQAGEKQYKPLDGELVTLIVQRMHVKPSVVTPILAKIPGTISFSSALKIIEANLVNAKP